HQSVQFLRRGDDQEVVAADVADLHRAQLRRRVGEAAADAADQVVPGGEPGGVVDLLELVHVQPADGEHVPGGDPAGDVPGDGVAAGKSGERVERGCFLDLQLRHPADQITGSHCAEAAAGFVDHHGVVVHPALVGAGDQAQ